MSGPARTAQVKASEVRRGDVLGGWAGYSVVRWESHPSNPAIGRVHLFKPDRFGGFRCYTPKNADELVEVIGHV